MASVFIQPAVSGLPYLPTTAYLQQICYTFFLEIPVGQWLLGVFSPLAARFPSIFLHRNRRRKRIPETLALKDK